MPRRGFLFDIEGRDRLTPVATKAGASLARMGALGLQAFNILSAAASAVTLKMTILATVVVQVTQAIREQVAAGLENAKALEEQARAAGVTSEEYATLDFLARRTGLSINELRDSAVAYSSALAELTDEERGVLEAIERTTAATAGYAEELNRNAELRLQDTERINAKFAESFGGLSLRFDNAKTEILDFFADILAGSDDASGELNESLTATGRHVDMLKDRFGLTEDEARVLSRQMRVLGNENVEVTDKLKELLGIYTSVDPESKTAREALAHIQALIHGQNAELEDLTALYDAGLITIDEYREALGPYIEKLKESAKAIDAEADALRRQADHRFRAIRALKEYNALVDSLKQQQEVARGGGLINFQEGAANLADQATTVLPGNRVLPDGTLDTRSVNFYSSQIDPSNPATIPEFVGQQRLTNELLEQLVDSSEGSKTFIRD